MSFTALFKYLRLPLGSTGLILIVSFSVLLSLALQAGLPGLAMLIIVISWLAKYSFVLLDHVADGIHELPVLSLEMVNPFEQRPLGTLLIIVIFYSGTMMLEDWLGEWPARILRFAGLTLLPAMIATMSVTGRFIEALNPVPVFGLVMRVPMAYCRLVISIAILWLVAFLIIRYTGLISWLPNVLSQALFMYLWLAMFACVGGMVYEQRWELGIETAQSPERTQARNDAELNRQRDKIMDRIFAQWRGGARNDAWDAAKKQLETSSHPLDEFHWLYERAVLWPDAHFANQLARWSLPRFLDAGATGEAFDITRARLRADVDFRPTTAAQLMRLIALARDAGDRPTARLLLKDFDRHYPNDPAAPLIDKLRAQLASL